MAENENDEDLPTAEDLMAEVEQLELRAAKAKRQSVAAGFLDPQREFADNAYPMLKRVISVFGARMDEMEDALEEYVSEEGSVIYPEMAGPLFGLIELAKQVGAAVLEGRALDPSVKQLAATMLETAAILEPMAQECLVVDDEVADTAEAVVGGEPADVDATPVEAQS